MEPVELKLKQASAVLGMPTKELQNLVQFGVIKPRRRRGLYFFDMRMSLPGASRRSSQARPGNACE